MSLEEAVRRFDPSQQFILDLLIWEVRAAMPCYDCGNHDRFSASCQCGIDSRGIARWCPSCEARKELARLNAPIAPPEVTESIFGQLEADPELLAAMKVEYAAGEDRRSRFEWRSRQPPALTLRALAMRAPCVTCGEDMSPFRVREKPGNKRNPSHPGHIYMAVCCPLEVKKGCSKSPRAHIAYLIITDMLER